MRQANFDWKLSETEPSESFLQMIRELKLSPFVGKLLWQRGYHEERISTDFTSKGTRIT